MSSKKFPNKSMVCVLICGMALLVTIPPTYANKSPRLYGKTYGEWSALWWQWANSIPASSSPVLLEGNVDCELGQQAPVYFLAGKPAEVPDDPGELPIVLTGERTCSIPRGVALFFPIVNGTVVNEEGDTICTEGDVGRPCTVDEKREILDSAIIGARNFCGATVSLDGTPAYELVTARTQSPPFTLIIGPDNVFGTQEGTVDTEVVSDGFCDDGATPLQRRTRTLFQRLVLPARG